MKIVVRARDAETARIEALLELAGAQSLSLVDAADAPLLEPDPGSAPLWPEVEIHALFDAACNVDGIAAWLENVLSDAAAIRVEAVNASASAGAPRHPTAPIEIGRRLVVVPADLAPEPSERVAIRLRMGPAFGTGQHPTTRMCLEWLERELEPGARVVDYGCGSGVLALAALALGAAEAWAVDIEPQALKAAAANAELNDLAHGLRIGKPDQIEGRDYDVVVANILAIPLIGLAGTFARLLAARGRVVLTGIMDAQVDGVISAYAPAFEDLERTSSEGWSLVTARLKGAGGNSPAERRD